jgi:para-nitrobenzyl esterase
MQWVQRNIGAFNGNKSNVLLYGQSAGATSVSIHMVADDSVGLFHRAAMQSSGFANWSVVPLPQAEAAYDSVLTSISPCGKAKDAAKQVKCLRTQSTETLLQAEFNVPSVRVQCVAPSSTKINAIPVEGSILIQLL